MVFGICCGIYCYESYATRYGTNHATTMLGSIFYKGARIYYETFYNGAWICYEICYKGAWICYEIGCKEVGYAPI